eukprot:TRINITY_DN2567_c0_g1_i1.p1 TRINITY_DN2567_c0_g1~~TRINITY_DN2567_c0_g1_i1.p1  ORF type:complete len:404 (-),score=96.71 TRINITY_DN2567_c0_g1_i1:203-1414(-)
MGLARAKSYWSDIKSRTGTVGFVAPEILKRKPTPHERTDVWSMGQVFLRLIGEHDVDVYTAEHMEYIYGKKVAQFIIESQNDEPAERPDPSAVVATLQPRDSPLRIIESICPKPIGDIPFAIDGAMQIRIERAMEDDGSIIHEYLGTLWSPERREPISVYRYLVLNTLLFYENQVKDDIPKGDKEKERKKKKKKPKEQEQQEQGAVEQQQPPKKKKHHKRDRLPKEEEPEIDPLDMDPDEDEQEAPEDEFEAPELVPLDESLEPLDPDDDLDLILGQGFWKDVLAFEPHQAQKTWHVFAKAHPEDSTCICASFVSALIDYIKKPDSGPFPMSKKGIIKELRAGGKLVRVDNDADLPANPKLEALLSRWQRYPGFSTFVRFEPRGRPSSKGDENEAKDFAEEDY